MYYNAPALYRCAPHPHCHHYCCCLPVRDHAVAPLLLRPLTPQHLLSLHAHSSVSVTTCVCPHMQLRQWDFASKPCYRSVVQQQRLQPQQVTPYSLWHCSPLISATTLGRRTLVQMAQVHLCLRHQHCTPFQHPCQLAVVPRGHACPWRQPLTDAQEHLLSSLLCQLCSSFHSIYCHTQHHHLR